jgi:hypothetical protein
MNSNHARPRCHLFHGCHEAGAIRCHETQRHEYVRFVWDKIASFMVFSSRMDVGNLRADSTRPRRNQYALATGDPGASPHECGAMWDEMTSL